MSEPAVPAGPEEDTGPSLEWLDWLTVGLGVACLALIAFYWLQNRDRPAPPDMDIDDPAPSEGP